PVKSRPRPRVYEVVYLQLAAYGLEPGDEIKLFARAEDNDPAGAKGAESPVATVRIISQEEFEKLVRAREGLELLQSKYQQARRRLESLAAEAEELQKKGTDKEAIAPLERLAQVMPLLEDSASFVTLAQRQRDLATRLKPLKDQEKAADQATRTRMRDLRAEQEELRITLGKLLDDIE